MKNHQLVICLVLALFNLSCAGNRVHSDGEFTEYDLRTYHVIENGARSNWRLSLSAAVLDRLNNRFRTDPYEFRACLGGERIGRTEYQVGSIYFPRHFERDEYMVNAENCRNGTVAEVHSHPAGGCIPSETDWEHFREQGVPMYGIICEEGHFLFVTGGGSPYFVRVFQSGARWQRELTQLDPCPMDRYCNGICFKDCDSGGEWTCEPTGGMCTH